MICDLQGRLPSRKTKFICGKERGVPPPPVLLDPPIPTFIPIAVKHVLLGPT